MPGKETKETDLNQIKLKLSGSLSHALIIAGSSEEKFISLENLCFNITPRQDYKKASELLGYNNTSRDILQKLSKRTK